MGNPLLRFGSLLLVVGLLIVAFPFISVSRLSNQSLAELPELAGVVADDDAKGARAIFDWDEFTLGTRTYLATDIAEVEAALRGEGFTIWHGRTPSQNGFSLECCGEYDALIVHLEAAGPDTIASTTAADADVTIAWLFFLFLGGPIAAAGAIGIWSDRQRVEISEVLAQRELV